MIHLLMKMFRRRNRVDIATSQRLEVDRRDCADSYSFRQYINYFHLHHRRCAAKEKSLKEDVYDLRYDR